MHLIISFAHTANITQNRRSGRNSENNYPLISKWTWEFFSQTLYQVLNLRDVYDFKHR